MARRLLALVMLVALVLGIGLVRWDPTGEPEFCTLEGKLVEPPPGWDLRRDHFNDCAWTLFNEITPTKWRSWSNEVLGELGQDSAGDLPPNEWWRRDSD